MKYSFIFRYTHNHWTGSGEEEYCSDPKLLHAKLILPITSFLQEVIYYLRDGNGNKNIELTSDLWIPFDSKHGRCYTLNLNKVLKKGENIENVKFTTTGASFSVFTHTEGIHDLNIRTRLEIEGYTRNWAMVDHEAFHLLDYLGKPCESDKSYSFVDCLNTYIHQVCTRVLMYLFVASNR